LFFLAGAFPVTGAALALMALRPGLGEDTGRFLTRGGGAVVAGGILLQGAFADLAIAAQPRAIFSKVMEDRVYGGFAYGWVGVSVLLFALGLLAVALSANKKAGRLIAIGAAAVAFLNVASIVMVRDGIRDYTLRAVGFEVWDRQVATNWSVVGIFLVLFVAALGAAGYLISVIAKARRMEERYA
jgi:hypothetical protein